MPIAIRERELLGLVSDGYTLLRNVSVNYQRAGFPPTYFQRLIRERPITYGARGSFAPTQKRSISNGFHDADFIGAAELLVRFSGCC